MKVAIGLFLLVSLCASCLSPEESTVDSNTLRPNRNTNSNSNLVEANANTAEDDENKLEDLVKLPFTPEENVWRVAKPGKDANSNRVPGPNDYQLTAVLKFSDEDKAALLESLGGKAPFPTTVAPESWFPAELIAKGETSGDSTLKGVAYPATNFLKTPYSEGNLIQINETDYFVLRLQTK